MYKNIAVVGLGYVGLPLAVALAKKFKVIGFDINQERVKDLKNYIDKTNEVFEDDLKQSSMIFSDQIEDIKNCDLFIVTVPTPIDDNFNPDLSLLENVSKMLGKILKKGDTVVYESTVYPGVTEDFCAKILENESHLKSAVDFFIGYSPERINPGDKNNTVEKITKVVSAQNEEVLEKLAFVYGSMNNNNIFKAKSIKVAEAAKVIENAQRDINIAFMNEICNIFNKMDISFYDVIDAASTKWNFLKFSAGLVGGHCIGVDPYYLAKAAKDLNYEPQIILSGRSTNEAMAKNLVSYISSKINKNSKILILGLTFKENVPDLRNTKIIDLINEIRSFSSNIDVHDMQADKDEAYKYYGITLIDEIKPNNYDVVIGAVNHNEYSKINPINLLNKDGLIFDIKAIWRDTSITSDKSYLTL